MHSPRLKTIVQLQESLGSACNVEQISYYETQARNLYERTPLVPTIGCEIEINHSALFTRIMQKYLGEQDEYGRFRSSVSNLATEARAAFEAEYDEAAASVIPKYELTEQVGIPRGNDAFWEFAHSPTFAHETLAAEVGILFDAKLIPDGYGHSLHVTLGNIDIHGGGPAIVVGALELLSGASDRIRLGMLSNRNRGNVGWARKGKDGLLARQADAVLLEQDHAVEFRTLSAPSKEQVAETLRSAQMLGAVLISYRSRQEVSEARQLSKLWPEFRSALYLLWEEKDLPAKSWGTPRLHRDLWGVWADTLDEAQDSDSLPAETVRHISKIVSKAEMAVEELRNQVLV